MLGRAENSYKIELNLIMIIGHIGARKNSKEVIGKNFREIAGKPMIDWSLDQLFRNKKIDKVIVSTDDQKIYKHSLKKGAIDIGLRPEILASDTASKFSVWKHSLELLNKHFNKIDIFVDLDCTSPLREDKDIDNAIDLYREKKPDMVMSCCDARKNPYFNLVELDDSGKLKISKPLTNNIVARQTAPRVFEHAASTYVISPTYLSKANFLLEGNVIPYIMPYERCIDIDTEFDLKIVELLMKEKYL